MSVALGTSIGLQQVSAYSRLRLLHACMIGTIAMCQFMLLCLLDSYSHENHFFAGYFIHDFFDMLIYDARKSLDLLLHHIVVRYFMNSYG